MRPEYSPPRYWCGKDGNIYVFDRDNMGKFNPVDNRTLYQELTGRARRGRVRRPAWFNGRFTSALLTM